MVLLVWCGVFNNSYFYTDKLLLEMCIKLIVYPARTSEFVF